MSPELEVGAQVRVKKLGRAPLGAVVVRDDGSTVRVRFATTGKERSVERARIIGARKRPARGAPLAKLPEYEAPRPDVRSRFKAPNVEDPKYLAHVRTRACCICAAPAPSEPHHYGPRGLGQKTDDRRTVPICRCCHDRWHDHGTIAPYSRAETEREFYRAQVDALLAYDPRVG